MSSDEEASNPPGLADQLREAREALADLRASVDSAQQLANMGDYDWHIPSDTNRWSDQLYRIFGYEPQCQNMDYPIYMEHCHPEDREQLTKVHQHAYATAENFQTTHRIIRTDGEVRYLLCSGEVIVDESGATVRMRGTSVDITERVLAEQERERQSARVHEEKTRRIAALEINDNVVQGLTAALYALEMEDNATVGLYVQRSLDSARKTITDLVARDGEELEPGDLVRSQAATPVAEEAGWPK